MPLYVIQYNLTLTVTNDYDAAKALLLFFFFYI